MTEKTTITRGLMGGEFTMQKNFRDDSPKFRKQMKAMWKMYRTGAFSQTEVACKFGLSLGITAMILRCDKKAPKKATRTLSQNLAQLRDVLRKEVKRQNAKKK